MPLHEDFKKIKKRFTKQYGAKKGTEMYYAWIQKKGYDDTKSFPKKKETKEKICVVKGVEIKEVEGVYHIEGFAATSHIDNLDLEEGIDIPDVIPKETLEDFANQMNTNFNARVMGLHHSEGKTGEYYGEADINNNPARVVNLPDGQFGLYVDTKMLMNDEGTKTVIEGFENGDLNSFSITYDTHGFMDTDFDWIGNKLVRVINPGTQLYGYTAASDPVNENAIAVAYGYKEFKEFLKEKNHSEEETQMAEEEVKPEVTEEVIEEKVEETKPEAEEKPAEEVVEEKVEEPVEEKPAEEKPKEEVEEKELVNDITKKVIERINKMEVKEKVLKPQAEKVEVEVPLEIKEFKEIFDTEKNIELKEQFLRAGKLADAMGLLAKGTSSVLTREYKNFGTNGSKLEYKGLGITTNAVDSTYTQSSAELQDVYDPIIYNALNEKTVFWNILAKDDYSNKGNNQVQFVLKTAANTTAAFYDGNSVATANTTRAKYQTKFKKVQVGVSVDGDMIAAARGGPIGDVFALEVQDSVAAMLSVVNAALFAEAGAETSVSPIGLEYITDSAGNTTLYGITRSSTNKLAPDSAGDTYINQSSTIVSMGNLRAAYEHCVTDGSNKSDLIFVTSPTQGILMRGKMDDARRYMTDRDTRFGFATDLFIDGIPVFEDKDCNTDDWFCVDMKAHRVAIWVPPTIEKLGKTDDSEGAFIKMYFATYNTAPRRMVQIYGCATS